MKKIVLVLLAAALLLTACSAVREDEQTKEYSDVEPRMKEVDLTPNININPVLYFFNESLTKLQAESRVISVPSYDQREEYVVNALLEGPVSEELTAFASGLTLEKIEMTPDIINVYLGKEAYIREEDLLNAKLAITATLSDFTGKKYVNILINGLQTGYRNDTPTGVLQKITNDLSEERLGMRSKSQSENPEMHAALYYLDSSETYLLPEVRRLVFRDNDYVRIMVEQLLRGPEDTYNHKPSLDSSVKLLDYEIASKENGKKVLKLKLNKEPVIYTEGFSEGMDGKRLAIAALTYTLVDFIPDISAVEIQIGEAVSDGREYKKSDFEDLIGSNTQVYLPNSNMSTLLVGVERIIPQGMAEDPYVVLGELMKGPAASDRTDAYPAMPAGITIDDVKDLYIANNRMVLDLKPEVAGKLQDVSSDNEFIMIYSIVNTLTNFEGIRSVQFLLDGERVFYLGGDKNDRITVIDPIIKNPGIIRY